MSRTIPAWTVAGILAAMLCACIHAFAEYVLEVRDASRIGPRTDNVDRDLSRWTEHVTDRQIVDPFGGDWQ